MSKLINYLKSFSKHPLFCAHEFKGVDMQLRDSHGVVRWSCCKCGKEYQAESGLDILKHGKCIGEWRD